MLNLFDYNRKDLEEFFVKIGEKSFRASQLINWMHQRKVIDFALMTNFSLRLRHYLQENTVIELPTIKQCMLAQDGTRKWLLELKDKELIETVFIPERNRGTLCVSSQVGCGVGCKFCATGNLGFKRNLRVAEIIGQLWLAGKEHPVTNVVMMGMGEPLFNFTNVVKAADLMLDDNAYGLSKYRVTISTAGVAPMIKKLCCRSSVALAVSLHAANDELRNQLVPLNQKYPLAELMAACKYFNTETKRIITFEYVMLDNINDSIACAKQLVKLLHGINCKINLIPYNESLGGKFKCSTAETIAAFRDILCKAKIITTIRKSRGQDIAAACGQLVGAGAV